MTRIAVVGGGIAGLAAAHRLVELRDREATVRAPLEIVVQEASPRPGGKIATERLDGFLVEAGADSFSTRRADALELVEALGLGSEILALRGRGTGGRVLVLQNGRLEELPGGLQLVVPTDLGEILRSRLLSAPAKARVALELLRPPERGAGAGEDQATAPFLRRHFGAEYVERVAAPLLAGIHATDAERLSLAAAFPGLAGIARRHGSLIRAARRHPGGGGPNRVGLAGGIGSLVDALVRRLEAAGVELASARRVMRLEPAGLGFTLTLAGGGSLAADAVVLALPHGAAAKLLEPLADLGAGAAAALRAIPAASTATVSLGFRREDVRHPLDALGLLVPAREGRPLGACTFASTKFPGRAPAGAVLVRAYLGVGTAGGGELPRDDDALTDLALAELEGVLGLASPPLLARVHRFPHGNPQYLVGHHERIAAVEAALPPGLALAGCAYHGLGIPDCIASGRRAAEQAAEVATARRARTG